MPLQWTSRTRRIEDDGRLKNTSRNIVKCSTKMKDEKLTVTEGVSAFEQFTLLPDP